MGSMQVSGDRAPVLLALGLKLLLLKYQAWRVGWEPSCKSLGVMTPFAGVSDWWVKFDHNIIYSALHIR